jgi:CubicO group peptidase (beta-lactamase class C family)
MKFKFLIFLVAGSLALSTAGQTGKPQSDSHQETIEQGLVGFSSPGAMLHPGEIGGTERHTIQDRMAHYGVPGVSIAVIDNNQLAWTQSYGEIAAGSGLMVDETTVFQAASTTKLLVAVITLRLVQDGVLDLDRDANSYLKSWRIPGSEFTRSKKVTLRLLLTHQSGFNRPDGGFDRDGQPTLAQTLNGEYPAKTAPALVEFMPGSRWQYSNFGYLIVQQIIEDVTQRPFADTAQEVLFDPLGMGRSTFAVPIRPDLASNEALPHDSDGITREPSLSTAAVANGGLRTTPGDLAIFTIELMKSYRGQSNLVLNQKSAASLFEKQIDVPPEVLGLPLEEGLGILLSGTGAGKTFLHPGDNQPGASCWLSGVAASGQGAIIMTNGVRGNLLAMEVLAAITVEYAWPSRDVP